MEETPHHTLPEPADQSKHTPASPEPADSTATPATENSPESAQITPEAEDSSEHVPALPEPDTVLERVPGYFSVKEAARIMGVSERSVYGYIENGKLPGARIGNVIVVIAEAVHAYERRAPGRIRTTTPPWHMPPSQNLQFLTTITARMYPGQGGLLEDRLYEIRMAKKHRLLGTAARYIARNEHDPDEVEIVLIWRSVVMPSTDVREAALGAFYNDLADIIDWGTISRKEGRVLMHA